jgi:two-component system alkaline phosphatase synthesis response regulator PhoP
MDSQPRILLVEDEKHLREVIKMNLELEDYEVVTAATGKTALKMFGEQAFHLIILDVMLPEIDGFTLCEQMRLRNDSIPILFLTAKDTGKDKILGLKKGADDYMTKPFNLEEFLLRVKALVRRSYRAADDSPAAGIYRFGSNEINFATYEAKGARGSFNLTKKEVALLKLMIERRNEVVSRQEILQFVWGYDVFPSTRTIDNFILNFRKNFEQDPRHPVYFHSVRGVGYKFTDVSE